MHGLVELVRNCNVKINTWWSRNLFCRYCRTIYLNWMSLWGTKGDVSVLWLYLEGDFCFFICKRNSPRVRNALPETTVETITCVIFRILTVQIILQKSLTRQLLPIKFPQSETSKGNIRRMEMWRPVCFRPPNRSFLSFSMWCADGGICFAISECEERHVLLTTTNLSLLRNSFCAAFHDVLLRKRLLFSYFWQRFFTSRA